MPSGTEDVSEAISVEGSSNKAYESVTEAMNFASPLTVRYVLLIAEPVDVLSSLQTDFQSAIELVSVVAATANSRLGVSRNVLETVGVVAPITIVDVLHLADQIVATGAAQTTYSAVVEVLAAMLILDSLKVPVDTLSLLDTAQLSEVLPATEFGRIKFLATLLEAITVADSYANVLTLAVQTYDEIQIGDSQQLDKTLLAYLIDYVDVHALLKSPSDISQGVVMNLEGLRPISEYDNYNYNSLASFKGKFYGAADEGLFELDGDDDAGSPINAKLSSLMLDFGTSRQKRIRSAYLGYTATNQLVLRVRSVSQGLLTEDWYEAREVTSADAPRANIAHVGQGLKSRYWQFELVNVDGGDFEIDQLEMYPIFLGRRV